MHKGIDVSHWQGNIDFNKVKSAGYEFVIIKAGGSDASKPYKDKKFEENYTKAKAAGLAVGCYFFNGKNTINYDAGVKDAIAFIDIIKGKQFEYPVCMDIEAQSAKNKSGITAAAIGFCEAMEFAGYYVAIYASDVSGFHDRLNLSQLIDYDKWVARYGKEPTVCKSYGLWQYSSKGKVPGIIGNVDMNYSYKDYPSFIKKLHLNGF